MTLRLENSKLKEFNIFKKEFTWTNTKIINYLILINFVVILFITFILKIEDSNVSLMLIILSFSLFVIGQFLKLSGLNLREKLEGKWIGKLIFETDYIELNGQIINLHEIEKIEISGVDWVGLKKSNFYFSYSYENGLSNGINNFLTIQFINKSSLKIQFQKNYFNEFKEIESIITHYYIERKIGYLNCVDILCLSDRNEYENFKKLNKHHS